MSSNLLAFQASRRGFLGAAGAGIGALALAGCSSGASESDFVFTFWGTGAEKKAVSTVVNDFAKANKLTGKPQSIPESYETKLNTLLAASNPPDAGYLTQGMAMRLGEQGKLVNVLDYDGFDTLLPSTLHYYADGKAVNQTCIETYALWYDKAVVERAGVTPPATSAEAWDWDALVTAAITLTVDSNGKNPSESGFDSGSVQRYGVAAPTNPLALTSLLKSNGIDLFDEAGTRTNIDSPEAIEVMQAIADLIFEHRVSPTDAEAANLGGSTALRLASGRVAMVIDGQWALLDLAASEGLQYEVGVMPKFQEPFTTTVSGANGVFASSAHKEPAMELLLQLADPAKVPLYAAGLWMPPIESYYTDDALVASWIDNDVHPANYRTAVMDPTRQNSVNYPAYTIKNFSAIEAALSGSLPAIFTEKSDMKAKCAELAAQINPLMQGAYQFSA